MILFTNHIASPVDDVLARLAPSSTFILVDTNTAEVVLPRLVALCPALSSAYVITIPAGDINKGLNSLSHVWRELSDHGATRRSLLFNVGGGMVTDLGAFAASTFKRGIRFVNIPTTLLAAVDASVGGKTGINFNGLKNEVGTFTEANEVIISTLFFNTLPVAELRSGYAEMLKHAFLTSTAEVTRLLEHDVTDYSSDELLDMLRDSVEVKRRVVAEDPTEQGIRRSLNLGHTAGHAFETLAMERNAPIPHGYAVAYGLVVALILSHLKAGLPTTLLYPTAAYVKEHYGIFPVSCDDYPRLLALMGHDKKNERAGQVSFTLLQSPGQPLCGITATAAGITAALDIYCDLTGC